VVGRPSLPEWARVSALWLILCHSDDPSARWAYEGLKQRDLAPLELVTAEMLGPGLRWDHRVGADGASIEISFSDGRVLNGRTIRGVLNRMRGATGWRSLHRVRDEDRSYAEQELAAFFLSWLSCLPPPILNRPTPQGLAGRERHMSEWVLLATAAGLPTVPWRQSGRTRSGSSVEGRLIQEAPPLDTVLVIDRNAFGTAPPNVLCSCKRLATLAGTAILGIDFSAGALGRWTFSGATPQPDLRIGGQQALDALAEILQAEGEGR
jgi:hypothetical protein